MTPPDFFRKNFSYKLDIILYILMSDSTKTLT
jgi:hypothetical protein